MRSMLKCKNNNTVKLSEKAIQFPGNLREKNPKPYFSISFKVSFPKSLTDLLKLQQFHKLFISIEFERDRKRSVITKAIFALSYTWKLVCLYLRNSSISALCSLFILKNTLGVRIMETGIFLRANSKNIERWLGRKIDEKPTKWVADITFSLNAL